MTRGIRLEPKIDITFTVRDLTVETAPLVQEVFGKAFVEVKTAIRLTDPTQAVEAAIEIANRNPSMEDVKDAVFVKAMRDCGGNKRAAAKLLGISERNLYRWINKKGMEGIEQ